MTFYSSQVKASGSMLHSTHYPLELALNPNWQVTHTLALLQLLQG